MLGINCFPSSRLAPCQPMQIDQPSGKPRFEIKKVLRAYTNELSLIFIFLVERRCHVVMG